MTQFSFTARLKPGSPREGDQHAIVQVFSGPVLESGLAGTRGNAGALTFDVDEAEAFVHLVNEHERQRLNRVVTDRARTVHPNPVAVRALATEMHDAECNDMPGCEFGVTGAWLMIARDRLAEQMARAELGLEPRERVAR